LKSKLNVYTKSPIDASLSRIVPLCEVTVVVSAKHESDDPGPHAAQQIPNKIGFQASEPQAATHAVHAPGANGPDCTFKINNSATTNTFI